MTGLPRPRRIIRRAVMAVAGVVLLVACYISTWLGLEVSQNAGWLQKGWLRNTPLVTIWVYYRKPAIWYAHSDLPGEDAMFDLMWWTKEYGESMNPELQAYLLERQQQESRSARRSSQ